MKKWGIIGTGKIARRFATDLALVQGAVLAGVTARNQERARKFAGEFQTPRFETKVFASINELLASDVDVIYVATPHTSHLEHAWAAIAAGKPVLCEKPLTMNRAEAAKLFSFARAKKVFVMEAMWTRFFPVIKEVIEIVKSGRIGRLQKIEASFGYHADYDATSRVFDLRLGGGSLLDVGVYPVSLARMLIEEAPVQIESSSVICASGADESASWKLHFASGVTATGESSVVRVLANEARVTGSEGEIRIPKFWCAKEFILNGEVQKRDSPGQGFQFEAEEVTRCLDDRLIESPLMPHQHTLDVMKTMDDMRKQWGLRYPAESLSGLESTILVQ